MEATKALLELGAGIGDGMVSPACRAASRGGVDCMKAFIDDGFDPNTRDRGGLTTLHHSSVDRVKNPEMLEYFLAEGGEARMAIDTPEPNGETPLHLVADGFGAEYIRYYRATVRT